MRTNKSAPPLYITMKNRANWLWEWIKIRNYQLATNELRNTYLYIYYTTLFQAFNSRNFAAALTSKRNRQFFKPIKQDELDAKIQIWKKFNHKFTNETIIKILGITEEEAEILKIGQCKKEKEERALRKLQRQERNAEILILYGKGCTQKEISERLGISISTVKRVLRESRNYLKGSNFTITGTLKKETAKTEFISPSAESLYSLHKEESCAASDDEFDIAFEKLKTSKRNIFVCGSAGTGKSTLIKKYLESLSKAARSKVLIVAPTAKAADLVDGLTIHKAFELPSCVQPNDAVHTVPKALQKIDTLIVDEISMMRYDVFEKVADVVKYANEQGQNIRVIVVGDFGQLKPVVTKCDAEAFKMLYPNAAGYYAFHSSKWQEFNFEKIVLHKVMRQDDAELVEHLNGIKYGRIADIKWFNDNVSVFFPVNPIYICAKRNTVEEFNHSALNEFMQEHLTKIYKAKTSGVVTAELPCPAELELGVGVRVMSVCNSSKYKNGNIGTVKEILDDAVVVKFDNGRNVTVKPIKFELDNGTVYTQLPLMLAYAITVHKSQGSSYEKAVIVCEDFFEPGMLYTALSRCTRIENLSFIGKFKPDDLKIDTEALEMTLNSCS